MRCPSCGRELAGEPAYCPHCGRPTDAAGLQAPVPEDLAGLIDQENEERAEAGQPPLPGGTAEARASHAGPVAASVIVGLLAVFLVAVLCVGLATLYGEMTAPSWRGSSYGGGSTYAPTEGTGGSGSGSAASPVPQPSYDGDAAGRYYAFWQYDDEVWGYVFDLFPDGTGEFHLFLDEDGTITLDEVDAEDFTEPLVWTQQDGYVTVGNPDGEDTLPDAPNGYVLSGSDGARVLTPTDDSKYPNDPLYEDFDEALANMT